MTTTITFRDDATIEQQVKKWLDTDDRYASVSDVLMQDINASQHLSRVVQRLDLRIDKNATGYMLFRPGKTGNTLPTGSAKSFSHARYNEIIEETVIELKKLGLLKGGEYAGDDDRLANFRRNAIAQGLEMEAIWGVYAAKHWDAIMQYIKDINTGKTRPRLESLNGRAHDLMVYLVLFICILEERGDGTDKPAA